MSILFQVWLQKKLNFQNFTEMLKRTEISWKLSEIFLTFSATCKFISSNNMLLKVLIWVFVNYNNRGTETHI